MIDDTEFSELTLLWDSREQSNVAGRPRVKRLIEWFERRGGMVDSMALPRCDYHIGGGYDAKNDKFLSGSFRGKDINLGIEYKTFNDYNGSKEDLNSKLFEAGKLYDAVALFVEENNFALSFTDIGTFIKIPQVAEGNANITQYAAYKNHLDTLASDGIHIRTFQSEIFFEEDVYSVLLHLAKDCHTGLHIKGKDYTTSLLNVLGKFEGIGGVKAHKIIDVVPNLQMLIEYLNYDENNVLENVIGPISTKTLRSFVSNQSRVELCKANYNKLITKKIVTHDIVEHIDDTNERIVKKRKTNKISNHLDTNNVNTIDKPPKVPQSLVSNDSGIASKDDTISMSLSIGHKQEVISIIPKLDTHDMPGKSESSGLSRHMLSNPLTPPSIHSDGNDQEDNHSYPPDFKHVINLDNIITDFCFEEPKADISIIAHCKFKGYNIQDIHSALLRLAKTTMKKFKQNNMTMYAYRGANGIRAMPELDIGV